MPETLLIEIVFVTVFLLLAIWLYALWWLMYVHLRKIEKILDKIQLNLSEIQRNIADLQQHFE